jgi:SAM-dependent methyltransferase
MIRKFMEFNKYLSKSLGDRLAFAGLRISRIYENDVKSHMSSNQTILDIGGGKKCKFIEHKHNFEGIKIFAVDISDEELSYNNSVDGKIVADITKSIPVQQGSIDMIVSSSVLEHLKEQEAFVKNAHAALKEGGYFIHAFPGKYALFAIINQIIPHEISQKILFYLFPGKKLTSGFQAYYDKCCYVKMKKLLETNGFYVEHIECNYYQSSYFSVFFPAYILSLIWDMMCFTFSIKNLCAYMCVTAKKINTTST